MHDGLLLLSLHHKTAGKDRWPEIQAILEEDVQSHQNWVTSNQNADGG